MAIFELTQSGIHAIAETTFSAKGWRERDDLQRLLRDRIELISPDTLVIAEEFGEWDESSRRIDLLGIDRQANLVVIELKRTADGGHMELQAIRYAAMVARMRFDRAIEIFADYLATRELLGDAQQLVLDFLGWPEPDADRFGQDVRIVLASAEFSKELTTTVLWLNDHDLDVRCVRLKPSADGERTLVDIQQVLPLPEVADYVVSVREKSAEAREARRRDEAWAGDYFVNVGMDNPDDAPIAADGLPDTRHWDYCRRFGYVSAGGAKRYRNFLARLRPGDPIFAYVKGSAGYVGHGIVTREAVPFDAFVCGDGAKLAERLNRPNKNEGRTPDDAEYAVAVRWTRTVAVADAKRFAGIFAPIAAVCPLKDATSLQFLRREFHVEDDNAA